MIKNFIVPIDFSEESLKGLELSILFTKKIYSNIQMVYVQKKTALHFPSEIREEYKFAKEKFEKILSNYSPNLGNNSKLPGNLPKHSMDHSTGRKLDLYAVLYFI